MRNLWSVLVSSVLFIIVVVHHKYWVMRTCLQIAQCCSPHIRVSWSRILWHDMSKFSASEFGPYARRWLYANLRVTVLGRILLYVHLDPNAVEVPQSSVATGEWANAFRHHSTHNDHHHSFWGKRRMPEQAVAEMVADWVAAEAAYSGKYPTGRSWSWLGNGLKKYIEEMHPVSAALAATILVRLGYGEYVYLSKENIVELIPEAERGNQGNMYTENTCLILTPEAAHIKSLLS